MGLCKCDKRKVTNLFCFEHAVNVCEYCLVADHERCIVQSYVLWLQDNDYNPICLLCKNFLKDEETVRLKCYDVFHLSCIDKYASQLPANTAPAGYQCPKCKESIFPANNLASPVIDVLKEKLKNLSWSRIGLGQSLLPLEDLTSNFNEINETNLGVPADVVPQIINSMENSVEIEANGFVIVNDQTQFKNNITNEEKKDDIIVNKETNSYETGNIIDMELNNPNLNEIKSSQKVQKDLNNIYNEQLTTISHNRTQTSHFSNKYEENIGGNNSSYYDSSLGMVLNMGDQDRDTGDYKYQRRPLFEWLNRWLKSRQLLSKVRMTRQKKYLFTVLIIFISLFTLIIIFSQLGSDATEDDPAFDPMNNPNIRVQ